MPVTFPKGEEPSVLSENPNGPKDQKEKDGQKVSASDLMSKGPVKVDQMPPAASKEELQARKEQYNQ